VPRNVRNFWITVDVDGNRSAVASGPQSATGGFQITIEQRHNGEITRALQIIGTASPFGVLTLEVLDHNGNTIATHRTER
jgi:hypothetical protein